MLMLLEGGRAIEKREVVTELDGSVTINISRIEPGDAGWDAAMVIVGADLPPEPSAPTPSEALERAKTEGLAVAHNISRQARELFLTDLPGQEMIYTAKREEAERMLDDTDPAPAAYPFLAAEIGITGSTLIGVGEAIRATSTLWQIIGPRIEAARVLANINIRAAADPGEVDAALQQYRAEISVATLQ